MTETYVVSPDPDVAVLPLDPSKVLSFRMKMCVNWYCTKIAGSCIYEMYH